VTTAEWTVACLDRLCIHCWCGESLIYELDREDDAANPRDVPPAPAARKEPA
jgi:hypothetical protein